MATKPTIDGTLSKKIYATLERMNARQLNTLSVMLDAYLKGDTEAAIAQLGTALNTHAHMAEILQLMARGEYQVAFNLQDKIRRQLNATNGNGGR